MSSPIMRAATIGVTAIALLASSLFGFAPSPVQAAQAPEAVAAATARPAAGSDAETAAFLGRLNTYRSQNGLGPVALDQILQTAADWMSQDVLGHCLAKGYYGAPCDDNRADVHHDSLGRYIPARLQAFGYPASASTGEITFMGTPGYADTADQAFTWWRNSPPHNAQMLTSGYSAVGISRACSGAGCVWVTDFGSQVVKAGGAGNPGPPSTTSRYSPAYVNWVQQSLNQVAAAGLTVDGIYGPKSTAAVKAFQTSKGLTADGIVGPLTEAALMQAGAPAPPIR